jgi:hypothetical protein
VNAPGVNDGVIADARSEQWWMLHVQPEKRYTLETIPSGDLDTVITIFDARGTTELATNDDGDSCCGSKLQYATGQEQALVIRVHSVQDTSGAYKLSVTGGTELLRLAPAQRFAPRNLCGRRTCIEEASSITRSSGCGSRTRARACTFSKPFLTRTLTPK